MGDLGRTEGVIEIEEGRGRDSHTEEKEEESSTGQASGGILEAKEKKVRRK